MGPIRRRLRRARCRYHGQPPASDQPTVPALLAAALAAAIAHGAAAADGGLETLGDVLVVKAARAWETDGGEAMYFEGGLELRGRDWRIEADRAQLQGALADPELVVVEGAPARIVVGRQDEPEPLEGHGRHLEYEPRSGTVRLRGGATIVKGQQSISSESIRYLLEQGTFAAGAHGRVRVVTRPK
jgi:lipopolysaccharide transport protein LptA